MARTPPIYIIIHYKKPKISAHDLTLSKLHRHDSWLICYPDIPRMVQKAIADSESQPDDAKTSHLAILPGHGVPLLEKQYVGM